MGIITKPGSPLDLFATQSASVRLLLSTFEDQNDVFPCPFVYLNQRSRELPTLLYTWAYLTSLAARPLWDEVSPRASWFCSMWCVLRSVHDQALHTVKSNIETLYSRTLYNSNLQGKSKKVRVIGSSKKQPRVRKKQFLLHSEHFNHI